MDSNSRVLIAGAQGIVGSAIKRNLESKHYNEIYWVRRKNCDLRNRIQVDQYFEQAKPEYVFVAAARNTYSGFACSKYASTLALFLRSQLSLLIQ